MTFSKDQIQALVAEIDGVLQKPSSRLSWMSGEATQQRRVLERVRNYLVALQKHLPIGSERSLNRTDLLSYDISYQQSQSASPQTGSPQTGSPQTGRTQNTHPQDAHPQDAQQMLQVVMQEMAQMRSSLMQPLQADLNAMQQQREALRQEIQQLEGQRRSYGSLQNQPANQQLINEFLQVLMGRLQESIPQQVAQTLRGTNPATLSAGTSQPAAYESVEQLRSAHAQSDQLILNLDSTLRVVFEALQRDVNGYQESLAHGLDRMHSLGQQSEMMFNALITHLAQQLGREASTYLQTSGQLPDPKPTADYPSLPPRPPAPSPAFSEAALSPPTEQPASSVDRAIDSWLQSMSSSSPASSAAQSSPGLQPPPSLPNSQEIEALLNLNSPTAAASSRSDTRPLTEDPTDIDAALRLLQQLSVNLTPSPPPALTSAEVPSIDTLDGLDEFYELFDRDLEVPGSSSQIPESSIAPVSSIATPVTVSGQAAGLQAGIEAMGNFDPTDGWDLLDDQPPEVSDDRSFVAATSTPVSPPPVSPPPVSLSPVDPTPVSSTPIAPADQIHSLDDLFEELPSISAPSVSPVDPAVDLPTASQLEVAPDQQEEREQLFVSDDDRYIPAAPEESLLPAPDRREAPHQEFWLDDLALSRLSEDLSSLESGRSASDDRASLLGEGEITFTAARTDVPASNPAAPVSQPPAGTRTEAQPPAAAPQLVGEPASPQATPTALPAADQSFAFSLDDLDSLDDLFEQEVLKSPTPATPIVTATPVSVSESFGFTLEGMDDLFADVPAPTTTPIPPPDSSPPTIDEPLGFTLEGMDDLFADLPAPESDLPPQSPGNRT